MDLAKEGAHEVQGAHRGVLKKGEGLQDEAAPGCQHPQGRHHLTVVQSCCAHLLPASTLSLERRRHRHAVHKMKLCLRVQSYWLATKGPLEMATAYMPGIGILLSRRVNACKLLSVQDGSTH